MTQERRHCHLFLAILVAGEMALGGASAANFQPDHLLYSFDGQSGRQPELESLLATFNRSGKLKALYGTTVWGGAADRGVLFKFTLKSGLQVIHSFGVTQDDGITPYGNLIMDEAGNLYGTTSSGLKSPGIVYKLAPDGTETVLHAFAGPPDDGRTPVSGVVMDREHNLYGVTMFGGRNDQGTLFKIAPDGTYSLPYMFGVQGRYPAAGPVGIVLDGHGGVFGIAQGGRLGWGVVFRLVGDVLDVLHEFTNGDDGGYPGGGLLLDAEGNLYGTTQFAGPYGGGVAFRVTKAGAFSIVYSFKGQSDGADPVCQLIADSNGVLYGTTRYGGGLANAGTVFSLTPSGEERVLHGFRPRLGDGMNPLGGLVMDNDGKLYGTTDAGGEHGYGTVFQITLREN